MGKKKADEPVIVKTNQPVSNPQTTTVVTDPVVKVEGKKQTVVYPVGEFKINETRVMYATKGTSFLAIAQQYNITLKYIFDFNDLKESEALTNDQLIYLQRKRKTGANQFHTVAEGESLYDIAQQQGIRLDALMQLNILTANQQPAAGEQLYLQAPAPAAPKLSNKKNTAAVHQTTAEVNPVVVAEILIHIVQPKETLYAISKKYEVSLAELQQWNNLTGTDLKEGMELIINK